MKVPSGKECEALMLTYEVPKHIRKHTETVRGVAVFLAKKMIEKGVNLGFDAVEKGALMHDLAKMHCIKNKCRHAQKAGEILAEKGYPEFGEILRLHGLDEVLGFTEKTPLEAKIVWYADKRVNHDAVVTLKERYDYLKEKYGSMSKEKMGQIVSTEKPGFALEKELLRLAGVDETLGGLK